MSEKLRNQQISILAYFRNKTIDPVANNSLSNYIWNPSWLLEASLISTLYNNAGASVVTWEFLLDRDMSRKKRKRTSGQGRPVKIQISLRSLIRIFAKRIFG